MTTKDDIGERVSRLEGGYEHLATKADVAALKSDIVEVRAELAEFKGYVDSRFARMEAQIAQLETRIFLRMGGLIIVASAAIVGLQKLLE